MIRPVAIYKSLLTELFNEYTCIDFNEMGLMRSFAVISVAYLFSIDFCQTV